MSTEPPEMLLMIAATLYSSTVLSTDETRIAAPIFLIALLLLLHFGLLVLLNYFKQLSPPFSLASWL